MVYASLGCRADRPAALIHQHDQLDFLVPLPSVVWSYLTGEGHVAEISAK